MRYTVENPKSETNGILDEGFDHEEAIKVALENNDDSEDSDIQLVTTSINWEFEPIVERLNDIMKKRYTSHEH